MNGMIESTHLRTLSVLAFALSLSGCARQSASADRDQPDPIAVRVVTPQHVRVPAEVVVSGTVETTSAPTSVGFLVSGKVIRAGPREGDFVKAGEVLAVIDPVDYQFAVEAAIAQSALARALNEKASASARLEVVEQARANLSQAEDEFRRMKTLYEKKSLAPNDFKKYETAYANAQHQFGQAKEGAQHEDKAAAKAALEQAEAAERIARKRLRDATLIAPISGFVSKRSIEEGAIASPGTPVFTIVELDPVEIQVGIRTAIPSFACGQYRPFPVRPREILAPRQPSKITATLEQSSAKRPSQMMAALGPVVRIGLKPQADWFIRAASA